MLIGGVANLHLLLRNPKQKISNGTSLIAELNSGLIPKVWVSTILLSAKVQFDSELRSRVKRKPEHITRGDFWKTKKFFF